MKFLIFVDCEATGPCPSKGELTQFGAVEFASRQTFHGVLFALRPKADNPALSEMTGKAFDPLQVFTDFKPIISAHANQMKMDCATPSDLRRVADWLERVTGQQ